MGKVSEDDITQALSVELECPNGLRSFLYYARLGMDYVHDWRITNMLQRKFVAAIASTLSTLPREREWRSVQEHPLYNHRTGERPPRVLVYSTEIGVHIGEVFRWEDGEIHTSVGHIGGNCAATHYRDLPPPPARPQEGE